MPSNDASLKMNCSVKVKEGAKGKKEGKKKNSCIPCVSPLISCTLKVCQLNPKTLPVTCDFNKGSQ